MLHPELPVVSFISVFLLLCSAPSHFRARNVATLSLISWLAILSIIRGVNSIAWADNVDIKLLVWCDITTKIAIGFSFAVPASALCLMIHLESIASARSVGSTMQEKRRRRIFEFVMCFVVPIIFMALHYIVQGHRFDIYQDQGCFPNIYVSLPAVFILWIPPLIFACISFIFAALSLRHFLKHRISFSSNLHNTSSISPHRYFRLMLLALVEMIWDLGTNIWILWSNLTIPLRPWTNWDDVHSNFSRVQPFPYILLPQSVINADNFIWWILPVSCFLVFIIFGTGREAMADYRAASHWIRRNILHQNIACNLNPSPLSSMDRGLPTTSRNTHVSIVPSVPHNVSLPDPSDNPSNPFRSSANQSFGRGSLSGSSVFTEAKSGVRSTSTLALPIPDIGTEVPLSVDVPSGVHSLPSTQINRALSLSGSESGHTISEPFSHSELFSSPHTIPSGDLSYNRSDSRFGSR